MSTTTRRVRGLGATALIGTMTYSGLVMLPGVAFADTSGISCTTGAVSGTTLTVVSGDTCTVSSVSSLTSLTVEEGGILTAPSGYLINLSVNGVDTGSAYDTWPQTTQSIVADTYTGTVVLTPTLSHTMLNTETFPIRQALYVGADGIDEDYSVAADLEDVTTISDTTADGLNITSTGEGQNGVWVQDGSYTLTNPTITMTGRGRSDFVGAGTGVVADSSTVTLDGATIDNTGTVRAALTSQGTGANLVVKNSTINVAPSEDMPEGYISNSTPAYMEGAPWKVGVVGSNRATILIGTDNKASYVNSSITSADWGALSTEAGSGNTLTAINSAVNAGTTSGSEAGYGVWAINGTTENLLGTTINAASYGTVITQNGDASVHWGDSDADTVAALNTSLAMGLADDELAVLGEEPTVVTAGKNAAVFNSAGNLVVDGATVANAGDAVFMDRGTSTVSTIAVDGSQGASFNSEDGIFFQAIDNDNAGKETKTITVDGKTYTLSATDDIVYTDTGEVTYDDSWDLTATGVSSRSQLDLSNTTIDGDLFNGARTGKNMVVNLDNATVNGLITSTDYLHDETTITIDNWDQISRVTNTVAAPVNNGVILDLANGATWVVPGTSYLTSLTGASADSIVGDGGKDVTVTIGGVAYSPADLDPETTYTGSYGDPIVVTVAQASPTASGGGQTTPVSSATKLKLGKHTIKKGKRVKATVTVTATGTTPTGTVKIYRGAKLLGSYALDSNGTLSVKLPKLAKKGTYKIRAVYTGDANVTGSTSNKAKLRVTKK
ncbi:beta strand repeat-containing protein [Nocardioides sp.]|uniref:beta strand repeat-containing protein n=1 Tax=Nocardioides sp. TaxID=35761 RepID=UPI0039E4F651